MIKTKLLLPLALSLCGLPVLAQGPVNSTGDLDHLLTAKLFPLFSEIQVQQGLKQSIIKNKIFRKISTAQLQRTKQALHDCSSVLCYAEALKFSKQEVNSIGDELIKSLPKDKSLSVVIAKLKKQGVYADQTEMADTSILRNSWNKTTQGINQIIDVYIMGVKPRYAKIDSISFNRDDVTYKNQLQNALSQWAKQGNGDTFYALPLKAALIALKANGRDEAARFMPLNGGLNAAPYEKVKNTDFSAYPYSVILIPGLGPEQEGVALDPKGAARCREGVERFRRGLAPFIVVSGGNVHPFKTPYNEAVEMKKYIVTELGIPEDVVLIEPDARHTTTNVRNTSRMIYNFEIPADKPVLIVTDESQSSYIVNRMTANAQRDLGFIPYRDLKKLSTTETTFYPVWTSLQVDPLDPLDP